MPDANPYTPPQSSLEGAATDRPRATKLAKAGAWLQLLPVVGTIGTVLGMLNAFSALTAKAMTEGAGDPAELSAAIGEVLISTALGFFGGMIGCVILGVAVFVQRNQPRWVRVIFWLSILPALNGVFMFVMMILSALRGAS
ncbi:MAG: MotA/TolQ/ExbB proton channel family protein [Prosthecobacter sp.]|uniref:MotA/TolQ/ExbB proton channel family protein n=1 Tax=Prosthecobacter sp. TaxID=1965333 RepID=UPI0039007688